MGEQQIPQNLRPATSILDDGYTAKKYYSYDTFGVTEEHGDTNFENFIGFTGAVNEGNDIYHMNARFYDANTSRFLSQDTFKGNAWEPWTQNLYSYCGNNPVNFVDPTGHNRAPLQVIDGGGYMDNYLVEMFMDNKVASKKQKDSEAVSTPSDFGMPEDHFFAGFFDPNSMDTLLFEQGVDSVGWASWNGDDEIGVSSLREQYIDPYSYGYEGYQKMSTIEEYIISIIGPTLVGMSIDAFGVLRDSFGNPVVDSGTYDILVVTSEDGMGNRNKTIYFYGEMEAKKEDGTNYIALYTYSFTNNTYTVGHGPGGGTVSNVVSLYADRDILNP